MGGPWSVLAPRNGQYSFPSAKEVAVGVSYLRCRTVSGEERAKARGAREKKGWTRRDLALLTGLHSRTIENFETVRSRHPSIETISKLETAMGITILSETVKPGTLFKTKMR